jgi:mono/diheme cytochrome c family protein
MKPFRDRHVRPRPPRRSPAATDAGWLQQGLSAGPEGCGACRHGGAAVGALTGGRLLGGAAIGAAAGAILGVIADDRTATTTASVFNTTTTTANIITSRNNRKRYNDVKSF